MFRSIFKKLLFTYLAIIIIIVSTLSLILCILYSNHLFDEKRQSLLNAAFKINQAAVGYDSGNISRQELEATMDSLGFATDSKIYLVRLDKKSLSSPGALRLGDGPEDMYLVGDLGRILDGEQVYRRKQYSDKFDMYIVFTGVPWKTGSDIKGAILLFSPVNHVLNDIGRINLVIWLVSLLFILGSAAIIYVTSLNISKPIKTMEKAAEQLAAGETGEDVAIRSRDELGSLARAFNYMKRQLTDTEKMRREFIANVSHDLRTPLTSINGYVEGMMDGIVKPDEYDKYLHIIHNETNRLTRLTNDILQLARIQSGSLRLNKETLNVQEIVSSVVDSIYLLMEEKSMSLSVDCDYSISVYADRDRLKQVLYNIVENSIKYGNKGGVITIAVKDLTSATRFSIADTGIGIPEDELPFIFEKFYRVDKSRQSTRSGTGLGLNIVKSLVELHGGKIWAKSEPGCGTEMILEIPRQ